MSKINTKDETNWRNKPYVPPFARAVLSFLDVFVSHLPLTRHRCNEMSDRGCQLPHLDISTRIKMPEELKWKN